MKRSCLILAFLLLLLPLAAACGGDGSPRGATTFEEATERGAYGVGVTTIELVDESRPTDANGSFPGADERRLTVEVWYPADPSAQAPEERDAALSDTGAPYPLIVFAHGFSSQRRQSASYTQHLASHGYVVVAPDFPLTNGDAPGGPRLTDLRNQPGDVSFLIDQLLAFNQQDGHLLEGAIDSDAIGLTGHSLGGFTTLLTVYGSDRDERIGAALPIAASGCFLTEEQVGDNAVPIMLLIGSNDLFIAPSGNRWAYDQANPPRYWVELAGGSHIRFADIDLEDEVGLEALSALLGGGEGGARPRAANLGACGPERPVGADPPLTLERQQELLRAFATPFFDAYLRGSEGARQFLEEELPGLVPEARTEFDPG